MAVVCSMKAQFTSLEQASTSLENFDTYFPPSSIVHHPTFIFHLSYHLPSVFHHVEGLQSCGRLAFYSPVRVALRYDLPPSPLVGRSHYAIKTSQNTTIQRALPSRQCPKQLTVSTTSSIINEFTSINLTSTYPSPWFGAVMDRSEFFTHSLTTFRRLSPSI